MPYGRTLYAAATGTGRDGGCSFKGWIPRNGTVAAVDSAVAGIGNAIDNIPAIG